MECRTENQKPMSLQNQLKPIPSGLEKSKIYKLFNHISRDRVKKTMQWIQVEFEKNPNISDEEAKGRRTLSEPEVKELFRCLGTPKGYAEID